MSARRRAGTVEVPGPGSPFFPLSPGAGGRPWGAEQPPPEGGPECPGPEEPGCRGGRRLRTAFSAEQLSTLESSFQRQQYLGAAERRRLAGRMRLSEVQVSAGGKRQWGAQRCGQRRGRGPWQGLCAVVTSPPSLPASPPDQDLVSEPSNEAQAAAAGAEDGAFLQPISPLRTSEWCCVLAAHVHGPAPASGPARGCFWELHLGGTASTRSGPQQRL